MPTMIKPSIKAYSNYVQYNCHNCGVDAYDKVSHYNRKKRHFCSMRCYAEFRKNSLPMEEQHAYKGIRKVGESKQVYHRNYVKNNPDVISNLKANRYARERGAKGSHSLQEWNNVKANYNNRCAFCGMEKKLTKDHIIPISKGGTNYISNIQPLCRNCNSKKHNKILNPDLL